MSSPLTIGVYRSMKRKTRAVANSGVKRQKVACPSAEHDYTTAELPQQASLLGIPVELRLQILELLLPDVHHPPNCDHTAVPQTFETLHKHVNCTSCTHRIPLRRDRAKCWPKILEVNRQIYNEGKSQMHKDKSVEIRINMHQATMCSRQYCTQHFHLQTRAASYFQTQLAHFSKVKLEISITLQDIIAFAHGQRSMIYDELTQTKRVVAELARALATMNGLTEIDATVNVLFEEELYADMEEALGLDIIELFRDGNMKESIGRSVCWLLGPFNRIHNLNTADYRVGITGLKNPPVITWNADLVKFLNEVALQSISRRSRRARENAAPRDVTQDLYFSDFV